MACGSLADKRNEVKRSGRVTILRLALNADDDCREREVGQGTRDSGNRTVAGDRFCTRRRRRMTMVVRHGGRVRTASETIAAVIHTQRRVISRINGYRYQYDTRLHAVAVRGGNDSLSAIRL